MVFSPGLRYLVMSKPAASLESSEKVAGYVDGGYILAHAVAVVGHVGRIVLPQPAPLIAGIDIERVAVALQLPQAGDFDSAPVGGIESGGVEGFVDSGSIGAVEMTETPCAVE